jgi:hypothetical protein
MTTLVTGHMTVRRFRRAYFCMAGLCLASLFPALPALAQQAARPQTAEAIAPFDITGYWVSVVTEDWRFRMVTPPKGDYNSVPLNDEARKIADAWDPAKDEADGNACKAYGAPAIMRIPGRVHVTWQDPETLKFEMDAGRQTRLFSFGQPQGPPGGWQGISKASWDMIAGAGNPARGGSLQVVTNGMKPGYLRKNGVPYSANAVVTEYYDRTQETNGDSWLVVTTIVDDPTYLATRFITSTHFKKEASAAGWAPSPCEAR